MKKLRIPWRRVETWLERLVREWDSTEFEPSKPCGCVLSKFYAAEGRDMYFKLGVASEDDDAIHEDPEYKTDSEPFEQAQIDAKDQLGRDFLTPAEALLILKQTMPR